MSLSTSSFASSTKDAANHSNASTVSVNGNTTTTTTSTIASSSSSSTTTKEAVMTTNGGQGQALPTVVNNVTPSAGSDLKILSHLKNIEKINEKRRIFLTGSTRDETTPDSAKLDNKLTSETNATTTYEGGDKASESSKANAAKKETSSIHTISEIEDNAERELPLVSLSIKYATLPKTAETATATTTTLKSPKTPPPKPPMLSRTRSIGIGDSRSQAPFNTPPTTPIAIVMNGTGTTNEITAAAVHEPIELRNKTSKIDTKEAMLNGSAATATAPTQPARPISPEHYEVLVEQLRCPGCASAMKAPIRLCKSGHSICEQCTRILLMCPLCKETFTNTRSLTVEALCAKAHFRCNHAAAGCVVRLPIALLDWHEKQCVYKPLKCFMGRVWQDCQWYGREIQWKEHLETTHASKVFNTASVDLIWNMAVKQKPLTGYYVFQVHDEMFNFYEIFDRDRVLFTMTCTSSLIERKYNFAYEVTLIQPDNEALAITQKFPVHSEYDRDILLDGTCVSITMSDLNKFIDEEKLLHYRVNILVVKSPRKVIKADTTGIRKSFPLNYQQTQFEGGNVKSVSSDLIITRQLTKATDSIQMVDGSTAENVSSVKNDKTGGDVDSTTDSEAEFNAYVERKWGTPQLNFNRKYLKSSPNESLTDDDCQTDDVAPLRYSHAANDDKLSLCSTHTNYTKKVSNTLRKSFRALKTDLIEMKPFSRKSTSPEKKAGK